MERLFSESPVAEGGHQKSQHALVRSYAATTPGLPVGGCCAALLGQLLVSVGVGSCLATEGRLSRAAPRADGSGRLDGGIAVAAVLETEPAAAGLRAAVSPTTASVSWTGVVEAGAGASASCAGVADVVTGAACACADAGVGTVFWRDAR